jgi:hypothetical protein
MARIFLTESVIGTTIIGHADVVEIYQVQKMAVLAACCLAP